MVQGIDNQPISSVKWVQPSKLHANSWNPNSVAPPEMELIAVSILEDGWTQPIVALTDGTIIDGFHRWTISQRRKDVADMTGGLVPVTYVEFEEGHREMSTIRHNRARGTHAVLHMANIVRSLLEEQGLSPEEVGARLQMETEEVDRLADRAGMTIRGRKADFGSSWKASSKGK